MGDVWRPDLGIAVSRETLAQLDRFASLIVKWNKRINLVSRESEHDLWRRHIVDSAQLVELAPPQARHWVDIGSGAGLPGLTVCIVAAELMPQLQVSLIESDKRKCSFLNTVVRELGLSARILNARAEDCVPLEADVISARALAPLERLLFLARRHMTANGICLFPKGGRYCSEIEAARRNWEFVCDAFPSRSNPDSVILKVGEIERV